MSNSTVSVAMAAYNGEKYIAEQIDSILPQLKDSDELVISINPSIDKTEEIIRTYQGKDCRVKAVICTQRGVLANFENAIKQCKNEIIVLSDQDDVWASDKIEKQLKYFSDSTIGGVCHGCKYIDDKGELMELQPELGSDREIIFWEIIKKNPVQGSTLAFRREMINYFLPFPEDIPMHDSWIGLKLVKHGRLMYIKDTLLLYRQHEGTVTVRQHGTISQMLYDRFRLIKAYFRGL